MRTRRTLAAVAVAVIAPIGLSACGTSFGAQTNQQYQAGIGANLRSGPVEVHHALFVDNGDGTATFSGALLAAERTTLTGATVVRDGQTASIELSSPITLPPRTLVTLGSTGELIVESDDVTAGGYVTLTLATSAGDVTVESPVVARKAIYDDVASAPSAR